MNKFLITNQFSVKISQNKALCFNIIVWLTEVN